MRLSSALCVGALGLALLGSVAAVSPAAAAPHRGDAKAAVAAVNRLEGPFVQRNRNGSSSEAWGGIWAPVANAMPGRTWTSSETAAANAAGRYTFPALGESGPIKGSTVGADLCLTAGVGQHAHAIMRPCDGSAEQAFSYRSFSNSYVSGTGIWSDAAGYFIGAGDSSYAKFGTLVNMPTNETDTIALDLLRAQTEVTPVDMTGPADGSTVTTKRPIVSGTGDAGATIAVTDETGRSLGTALVGATGAWTLTPTVELANGLHTITAKQTVSGQTSSDSTTFTVAAPVEVAPVKITAPASGSSVTTKRPAVSGSGEPGATVEVTDETGRALGSVTVGKDGSWTVTPGADLANGRHTVTATQVKDGATSTDSTSFTVADIARLTAEVVSVDAENHTALVRGTGEPGATIVVTGPDGVSQDVVVAKDGTWEATVPNLVEGDNDILVKQTVGNDTQKKQLVATLLPSPIVDPAIAGGAGVAAMAVLGTLIARRRRNS